METNSLRTLLGALIDYAGLYPPAELSMGEVVENYARYMIGANKWALGRLILPVARLDEYETARRNVVSTDDRSANRVWRLSVVADGKGMGGEFARISDFNRRHEAQADAQTSRIDSIEVKVESVGEIEMIAGLVAGRLKLFYEIPVLNAPNKDTNELLDATKVAGASAKIRTGGVTPETFPSSSQLVKFIKALCDARLSFKATAGLHHPLCSVHRLTYKDDGPTGMMHGFLNLFIAAILLSDGIAESEALELLDDGRPEHYRFDDDGITWKEHRITNNSIRRARESFALSFGSCSFVEPFDDLRRLNLL